MKDKKTKRRYERMEQKSVGSSPYIKTLDNVSDAYQNLDIDIQTMVIKDDVVDYMVS